MARMRVNGVAGHAPLPPTDHVMPGTYSVTCLIRSAKIGLGGSGGATNRRVSWRGFCGGTAPRRNYWVRCERQSIHPAYPKSGASGETA